MFRTDMLDLRPKANPKAIVQGENYRFTVLTSRLIRMEWSADGVFEDRATKLAVCRDFPVPAFEVKETEDSLEIITEHLHVFYDKQKFSSCGLSVALKGLIKHKTAKWHYDMPQITLFNKSTNLMGTCRTLDMVDGACELENGILDRHGFTVLKDKDTMVLGEDGWYTPVNKADSEDLYFFGYLIDHKAALRDFYKLSGAVPMLPRYALGNWWSRYFKYTEESYKELMSKFREKDIPLAVSVVDIDWHLIDIDPKYGNGWTGYTWNKDFFPDPKRFMNWLHDNGLKITLNIHPHDGIRGFEDCYKDAATAMGVDVEKEEQVEFDAANPKFMRTYLDHVLHPLEDEGVDFWWIDWQQMNGSSKEGYPPLWMLNHYIYTDNARRGTYPMTLSRYAGPGSHRYPLGFSGDTIMSWESLDFQPYFTNCASNIGYSWWSHDIGGHKLGIWSDDMQVRWCQYGVFSPIYRPHSGKELFFLKEPWNFPINVENTIADFMRLRHALVPYLYTMNYRNHAEGLPLCLPMYYEHPAELLNKLDLPNQYYFGSELIVCPITQPMNPRTQTGKVIAWIPKGDWFDFFSGRHYHGCKTMTLYRTMENYPVLAKAGGIVPLADDGCVNGAPMPTNLRLRVFAGADGKFNMYEDDEQLVNTRKAVTPMTFTWGEKAVFTVGAVEGDSSIQPAVRNYTLELVGGEKPTAVTVNGKAAEFTYDEDTATTFVKAEGITAADTLTFVVETSGKLAENDYKEIILERLPRYQIEILTKQNLLEAIQKATSRGDLLSRLPSVCEEADIVGEIIEIIASAM